MEQLLTGVQEDCGKNRFGGGGVHRFDLGLVNFKMPTGYSNGDVQ